MIVRAFALTVAILSLINTMTRAKPLITVKPCPFCGGQGKPAIRKRLTIKDGVLGEIKLNDPTDVVMIYCVKCLAQISDEDLLGTDLVERARDVLKAWNRRVNPAGFKP